MSQQIQITGGAKVRALEGVITGTSGVLSSVPLGAANGVATLDSGGKVPVSQLPSSVVTYLGTWNAATNTPTLVNGTGDAGDMYICNVAGTVNFGAGPVTFAVGDWVLYGSGTWQKSNGQNGTVTSVAASITGSAIGLTGSPITTAGTLAFAFAGTNLQYVNGAGNLTTFPTLTGYVPYTGATQDVDLGAFSLNGKSLHIKGTAGNGHLGLKHQSAAATGSANESLIYADTLGDLNWLNGNLYLSKFITSGNTAARSYTFPNANGTVALTSDLANYVDLTTAQTIGGTKTFTDATKNNGGIFLQNASSGSLAGYMNIGGLTNGVKFTSGGGVSNTFTLPSATGYTFTFPNATGTIALTSDIPTNPVGGTGTTNTLPKFTAASTIGNSNITDTGSLITLGSNSYVNGNVGIGSTPSTNINLLLSRNITGGVTSYALYQNGSIQSDVTTTATFNATFIGTATASFTVNNVYGYYVAGTTIGAGSAISTQQAYYAHSNFTGATNNYGFRGAIPSGTNRWNLYMDGTANNYIAGRLGIGTTNLTTVNLRNDLNITGGTSGFAIFAGGAIQSDVTSLGVYYRTNVSTQATTFTLNDLIHFNANQGTFGAGSTVTSQYGFRVESNMIGATNDYGFFGNLASASNVWNLYMAGTAANYLAGSLGIGTTAIGAKLQVNNAATVGTGSTAMTAINPIIFVDNGNAANGSIVIKSHAVGAGNVVGALRFASSPDGANYNYAGIEALSSASSVVETLSFKIPSSNGSAGTSAEIVRIDTNGLSIGTQSATAGTALVVGRNNGRGAYLNGTIPSTLTTTARYVNTTANTAAATFTLSNLQHYFAEQGTFGAGSTVTNQFGFFVDNTLTGATNNYGFYGNIASGTNRWNLYMSGTAANYMASQLLIGTTTTGLYQLDVSISGTAGIVDATRFGATGNGGAGRGVGIVLGASGSVSTVTVARLVGYQETASATANNASFAIQVANSSGTLTEYLRVNNIGSVGIGTSSLTGYNLRVAKNLTGATVAYGIAQTGSVQSDVTSVLYNFYSQINTAAASFTLGDYVHFMADNSISLGAGSSVTRQYGFLAQSSLTSATNNYGFFGAIASGTNRWNLYMSGNADNYLAGALGIGATGLTGYNLRVSINPSAATAYGIMQDGLALSSVTTSYHINRTLAQTQAATFTIPELVHYYATQGSFGAGSTVTNQYGFIVGGNLVGATANFGFYGAINSGTNRWNIYMAGTAANYMAGVLNIGTTTLSGYTLDVNGTGRFANGVNMATTSGNVGIGTTTPSEKLDVIGGALAAGNGTIRTGITYSTLGLIGTFTNHDLGIITNGTTKLTIASTGAATFSSRVNINGATDNASYALNISGDATFSGTRAAPAYIYALRNGDDSKLILKAGSTAGYFSQIDVSGWNGTGTPAYISLNAGSGTGIYINNGNNVLIGTTDDGGKVVSYTTNAATQFKAAGTAPAITFSNTVLSPTIGGVLGVCTAASQFFTGTASSDMVLANQFSAGDLIFGTNNLARMRVKASGVINITSIPTSSSGLVSGDIYSSAGVLMIV